MNSDKVLSILVTMGIIIYIIIRSIPIIKSDIDETKSHLDNIENDYFISQINEYVESKNDYYFPYEGATYCISINELISNGVISNYNEDKNNIIEATYKNGGYHYQYNLNCIEK